MRFNLPSSMFTPFKAHSTGKAPQVHVKEIEIDGEENEETQSRKYPRISRPVPLMKPEYDVVVVGSGYGGGVAASRMARAGKSVAVLELGRERWPGEYPTCLKDAAPELHWSGAKRFGQPTDLYHIIEGEGQNVFVANGLGGTSLLNANVFLRADPRTLALNEWPAEIRNEPTALNEYYARAEQMLQPTVYPATYPIPKKLSVFEEQAKATGQQDQFYRVLQTTFFQNGLNSAGVEMKASTGSGQDLTGVNDGSKNSVLMTYLPDAWNAGAEIFCECEARYIKPDPSGKGYIIFFAWHGDGRDAFEDSIYSQLMWIRAKEFVFLGAGAIGTTEILARSRSHAMSMSPLVGQNISGNGDILAFAYNTDKDINGLGREEVPPNEDPCGPCITGIIDKRNEDLAPNVLDGYVIEEGAIPGALAPIIQAMFDLSPDKEYAAKDDFLRDAAARLRNMVFGPYCPGASINRSQTFLVMSHDNNEGILTLRDDKPNIKWLGVKRAEHVEEIQRVLGEMAHSINGTLINATPDFTVHPLGGACMSSDGSGAGGAVNHLGQLFKGSGSEVYDGIVCVDGSIIPTALGVNPFATITALAERSCHHLAQINSWTTDESPNGKLNLFGKPTKASQIAPTDSMDPSKSVIFTEVLEGYIHIGGDINDFEVAEATAKAASGSARLYLSVEVRDVDNLIEDEDSDYDLIDEYDHSANATGTFSCAAISQDPLMITHGEVQFFTQDKSVSDRTNFKYNLSLQDTRGEVYILEGHKNIDSAMAFSVSETWKATTTLYTTIKRPGSETIVGRGILRITWGNFLDEMQSFGLTGTENIPQKLLTDGKFLKFFSEKTGSYFFSPFRPLEYPDKSKSEYYTKPAPKMVTLISQDGVDFKMKIWEPKPGTSKHAMPILFIPGASVDDQVFSLPTIPTNTIDYFTGLGYRCYVAVPRFGIAPTSQVGWTCYDARWDIKASMEYVREQEDGRKFYAIVHCLGSITTSIALLTGVVKAEWMQGMTVSQVFCDLRYSKDNAFKARHPALLKAYNELAGDWFPIDQTFSWKNPIQYLLDKLLRFYPLPSHELCNSAACHRSTLVFGCCFTHGNLNHATHRHMDRWFNGIHMNFLSHLSTMGATEPYHPRTNLEAKDLTPEADATFTDLVTVPGNLERLRGLKIQFMSGGANVVFDPMSTAASYGLMKETFGTEGVYERAVIDGYGHLDFWMGTKSVEEVYPRIEAFLKKCEADYEG